MTDAPKGAITTKEELESLAAEARSWLTVWEVSGLGSSSSISLYAIPAGSKVTYTVTNAPRIDAYWNSIPVEGPMPAYTYGIFLRDDNIGAHYNNHYLFTNLPDAFAYLQWAYDNTPEIQWGAIEDFIGPIIDRPNSLAIITSV